MDDYIATTIRTVRQHPRDSGGWWVGAAHALADEVMRLNGEVVWQKAITRLMRSGALFAPKFGPFAERPEPSIENAGLCFVATDMHEGEQFVWICDGETWLAKATHAGSGR